MFKVGDKVRCKYCANSKLLYDGIYEVEDASDFDIKISGIPGWWMKLRFEVAEEEIYMKEQQINVKEWLQTNAWFIRINNEEQFDLVQKWLKENYGYKCIVSYQPYMKYLTNTEREGKVHKEWVMHGSSNPTGDEIKFSFRTVVDKVEFPEVKTEKQKKLEELEESARKIAEQIAHLKEMN